MDMRGTGGVRRGGAAAARLSATALLSGALLLGGGTAYAGTVDPGDPGDPSAPADGPTEEAPAPPADGSGQADQGSESSGLSIVGGFTAGGHGRGLATFTPLLGDEDHPVPAPPVNEDLPLEVDVTGSFAQQVSCDPQDRPGVTAFAMLVTEHYDRTGFSGARPCINYNSFHHDGRALDWNLNAHDPMDRRIGDSVIHWLVDNDGEVAARFGIEYIIWNHQIWMQDSNRWMHYVGHPHDDHIHFSFTWDGAQMRTSWWTGVALTRADLGPCGVPWQYAAVHQFPRFEQCGPVTTAAPETGMDRILPGGAGSGLTSLQEALEVPVTRELDSETRNALLAWQVENDVPATGLVDDFTHARLHGHEVPELGDNLQAVLPEPYQVTDFTPYLRATLTEGDTGEAVELLQTAVGAEPDGDFGPKTAEALAEWEQTVPVLAIQAERRGDGPAVVTPLTWLMLERSAHPTIELRTVELELGDVDQVADPEGERAAEAMVLTADEAPYAGGAVATLQRLLGLEDDGSFGPQTEAAVQAVQEAADLEPTGVVDGATWVAVEEAAIEAGHVAGSPGREVQLERERAEKEAERKAAEEAAEERRRAEFEASLATANR